MHSFLTFTFLTYSIDIKMLTNVQGALLQFAVLRVVVHISCLTCFVCIYAYFFADDMWSQRTLTKWPESGASSQSVSSSLLVSHCQTGSKCWGLDSKEQQQTCCFYPCGRVGISL